MAENYRTMSKPDMLAASALGMEYLKAILAKTPKTQVSDEVILSALGLAVKRILWATRESNPGAVDDWLRWIVEDDAAGSG